jgi:hypothetical protein
MLAEPHTSEEEICPICDELLGELYSASKLGLPIPVASVSPDIRANLAIFCYRRSHLQTLGLAVAASCDEEDLFRLGGRVGTAVFLRSREQAQPIASHDTSRRKITLATGPLVTLAPIDDEPDEEID